MISIQMIDVQTWDYAPGDWSEGWVACSAKEREGMVARFITPYIWTDCFNPKFVACFASYSAGVSDEVVVGELL